MEELTNAEGPALLRLSGCQQGGAGGAVRMDGLHSTDRPAWLREAFGD